MNKEFVIIHKKVIYDNYYLNYSPETLNLYYLSNSNNQN